MKQLLKKYGITQSELSRRFNIPLRTVQHWCGGDRAPQEYIAPMLDFCLAHGADFSRDGGEKSE